MSRLAKREYFHLMFERYRRASKKEHSALLDEICKSLSYNRRCAIRELNGAPPPRKPKPRRHRACTQTYSSGMISVSREVWEVGDYHWSACLKALVPRWLPWIREHFVLTP
jgi:hypothetical protein